MRRRALVSSHAGSFTALGPTSRNLVSIANAGSLLAQNHPNAIYYNGVTYFGYNNGDNGNIEVRTYTHATGVTSAAKVIESGLETETHDAPALLMRASDHKLMVFYMKHAGSPAYLKIATTAESIAAFGARVSLHTSIGATDYSYPTVHQLAGLANQPIYLFFRDGDTAAPAGTQAWLTYTVSTDDGATWSAKSYVHKPTNKRPYWMVRSNGSDRIDVFISQDARQAVDNTPGAHFYFDGTTWRGTAGTALTGTAPFAYSAFTQVNDGSAGSIDPQDIVYAADGKPMVTWRMWANPVANRVVHSYFARWTGSAWTSTLVQTDSDEWFITDVSPAIVGFGRKQTSGSFLGGNQVYDIWRYTSSDNGASWGSAAVTSGTSDQIWYLVRVQDYGAGLRALWSEGTFTSFTDFDFGIFGVTGGTGQAFGDPDSGGNPPSCPATLQGAIDAAASGATIDVTGCTFHETVTINKALTITGGTIDGDGTRTRWVNVTHADVTLRQMTMTNAAAGSFQEAGLQVSAARFTADTLTLNGGPYACMRLWTGATDAVVTNCTMTNGPTVGLLGFQADRANVSGGRYHDNTGSADVGNESGGMKFGESLSLQVQSLEADHNVGPGVWLDISCDSSTISDVHAHHNSRAGIMFEIGDGCTITGCTTNRNCSESGVNDFQANGIFVSSSRNVTVSGNTSAWNQGSSPGSPTPLDIGFISQNRSPFPHDGNSATGNLVRSAITAIDQDTDWADTGGSNSISGNTAVADSDPRIAAL